FLTEIDGQPTKLDPCQKRVLSDQSRMRIINKARQIGISLTVAGEMLYRASTQYGYNANIVSTDKDEAAGKINYAISLYDSIPDELKSMGFKPTIWNRTGEKLAFHEPRYGLSTIISRS